MKNAILILPEQPVPDYAGRHSAAIRFGWRMKNKLQANQTLASAIADHLSDDYGVTLPRTRKEFKSKKEEVLQFDAYGEALETELEGLIKLHYSLLETFGTYAEFGEPSEDRKRLVPLTFFYSRHRLDYAWNLRKSQLVRGRYHEYLQEAKDDHGRLLIATYQPIHLTLTVPHQGGLWLGQRFYARQLIRAFAELRKTWEFKTYIYAGEYGLEVKRSKAHGLHIHIHSFLLQHPKYSVNTVREALAREWTAIMGNTSGYSGMHYETLYTWKKGPDGKNLKDENGHRVKEYIVPGVSPLEDYLGGVMECIKYHFKPDCLDREDDGGFDLPLIKEILLNTHNLRMYSRFGAFYKQPALNFNKLHEDPVDTDELSETEVEEEVKASSDGVEERLIDPRTMQPAAPGSYRIKVGHPLRLKYYGGESYFAREAYTYNEAAPVLMTAPPGLGLKQVIRLQICGLLAKLCDPDAREVGTLPEWATNKAIKKRKTAVDQ
jgi:hypothetical protein